MSADAILLHIKDSYYFEVPKWMWKHKHESHDQFPDVWVKLDPEFQAWQAHEVYHELEQEHPGDTLPSEHDFTHNYEHWKHQPGNHGKLVKYYLRDLASQTDDEGNLVNPWAESGISISNEVTVRKYKALPDVEWSEAKVAGYNQALSGKILVPQPFGGELRNLYEKDSGFVVSKFMVIELLVALIMVMLFSFYARQVSKGQIPKGRFWNFIDVFVVFFRDQVAKANIHHGADKFVPILWTMFFFILGCNLFGLVPWMGSPTGSISVTIILAALVLFVGIGAGSTEFGLVGMWTNLIPSMDLPAAISFVIKPMMFVIEVIGMFIKHAVLGVRLLANMVAGHVVLLAIMGLAIEVQTQGLALALPVQAIVLAGSVLLSCLELFVAFLQAYIFVLLAALFINAATHSH